MPLSSSTKKRYVWPSWLTEIEGGIRKKVVLRNFQAEGVFAREVLHGDAHTMRRDGRMDDELGEPMRMVLVGNPDFTEVTPGRRLSLFAVEQAIAKKGQFRVVRGSAAAGGGEDPASDPAGLGQFLESLLHAPGAGEWSIGKSLAQFQELPDRERTAVQRGQDVEIPLGKTPMYGANCHFGLRKCTIDGLYPLSFSVACQSRNKAS